MKKSQNIRKTLFWFFDYVNGGTIKRYYNNIRDNLLYHNEDYSIQKRRLNLENILNYAINRVPIYKKVQEPVINCFPVINKSIIKNNYNDFRSEDDNYNKIGTVVTSGSTGTPFAIEIDRRKKEINTADTIFLGELAGYNLGEELYYFKIWNKINKKSNIVSFIQNVIPYDVRDLSDEAISGILYRLSKGKSRKSLLAYSSVYDAISSYISNNNLDYKFNIGAIIAMSEALSPKTKEIISQYFKTNAVSRYSNVENGIIAQQLFGGTDFLINDSSYYIELLDLNSDKEVPYGKVGRIVITDLFNYRMPMIRYDTGDTGIIEEKYIMGCKRKVFTSIEGRRMDLIYDTKGSLVSSYVITNNMWKYQEIDQYQFIQVSATEYVFKLNVPKPFQRENELLVEFTGYFGEDAKISIQYVNEIPLLNSGKRKKVLNISGVTK